MTIKKILQDGVSDRHKKDVLELGGQVVDILASLPHGYEYRLKKLSNAMNSEVVLLIAKTE